MENRNSFLIAVAIAILGIILIWGGGFLNKERSISVVNDQGVVEETDEIDEIKGEVNLIFVGDIMLARAVQRVMEREQDPLYPFLKVAETIKSADISFTNLESPISDRGANQGSIYSFRAAPWVVKGLEYAGFDVVSVANNHIFDWGPLALVDTIDILKSVGIESVGAGRNFEDANRPVIKEINGTKIAFLAYTNLYPESLAASPDRAGISLFNLNQVSERVRQIKSSRAADIVIVSLHWGEEYQTKSNSVQKEIARVLVDAGVDIIIGHHPHVVQEIEKYKNSWVAYSLGNFVFDQNFSKETIQGLMLKVKILGGKIQDPQEIKIVIDSSFQPRLAGE
jgi:poly-gamma-glutamate capsule biosynthesis protein CapA/YwtB (metallophosphatase superfamily)